MNTSTPVVPEPLAEEVDNPQQNTEPVSVEVVSEPAPQAPKQERTWSEEIELAGTQLVDAVKGLIAEGNVRRLILRTPDNKVVLEIPLLAGAVVGGVVTVFAPLLTVIGAIASVLAHVKVEIVRTEETEPTKKMEPTETAEPKA
jgi:hypothetical protein